jgi:hypothetical protein
MAKRTDFQRQVVAAWRGYEKSYPVVCKADGSVEIKSSFFYRHGQTDYQWLLEVLDRLDGVSSSGSSREDWNAWPKTSYFVAILRPAAVISDDANWLGHNGEDAEVQDEDGNWMRVSR